MDTRILLLLCALAVVITLIAVAAVLPRELDWRALMAKIAPSEVPAGDMHAAATRPAAASDHGAPFRPLRIGS